MKLDNILTKILPREFYKRDTVTVAKDLIGKILVRKIDNKLIAGIISETESYKSCDPASHCYYKIGKTQRNKVMFESVGHVYVYLSYGIHYCFNITARDIQTNIAGGVLIRSIIPISGIDLIKKFRKQNLSNLKNLTNGPGKLTQALNINLSHYGLDLTNNNSSIIVIDNNIKNLDIEATPRIGISKAKEKLWRFVLKSN